MSNVEKNTAQGLGKYKLIVLFIAIFIALILGLLALNLIISNELQKNSREINIVGNQASLVQEMSKDIYTMISQYQKVLPYDTEKQKLGDSMDLFERRLKASMGALGNVSDPELPKKMSNPDGIAALEQAETIWAGYTENVGPILQSETNTQSEFLNALAFSDRNNQELTNLMNNVADVIQADSEQSVFILRAVQIIGIILAIGSFAFIIFYIVKILRKGDYELELAQKETTGILNTVREGLFLLDDDLTIGSQYSNEMKEIFEEDDIAGLGFTELLKRIVPDDKVETVQNFVKLLFDPNIIEDLIGSLNPLDNIEVSFSQDGEGMPNLKYLDFAFYRVLSRDETIENVLVSVRDMTSQQMLKQELEESKAESNTRMVILDEFLRSDPVSVDRFLMNTRNSLSNVNMVLKKDESMSSAERLDKIFVEIHRVKGESTTLGFSQFSKRCHEFETELDALKATKDVQGINFLPLTIKLDELIKAAEDIKKISDSISRHAAKQPVPEGETGVAAAAKEVLVNEWEHLTSLVKTMSGEYGKGANLVMTGFKESNLGSSYKNLVNNLSIQLIKNSLIHGIENKDERLEKKKSPQGRIDLILSELDNGAIELIMKDDGRGFDIEKIRQKLVDNNLITNEEAQTWNKNKLVRKAFSTGFSTADEVDMNAGRGVGLDVIKDSVFEVGGKLSLKQVEGKYCQFNITLPAQSA